MKAAGGLTIRNTVLHFVCSPLYTWSRHHIQPKPSEFPGLSTSVICTPVFSPPLSLTHLYLPRHWAICHVLSLSKNPKWCLHWQLKKSGPLFQGFKILKNESLLFVPPCAHFLSNTATVLAQMVPFWVLHSKKSLIPIYPLPLNLAKSFFRACLTSHPINSFASQFGSVQ